MFRNESLWKRHWQIQKVLQMEIFSQWLTNNQCNLLDSLSFYTMFQLKILETSVEKPESGRIQENSSSDRNIISPFFFLFSEMCLGSELTNSQGIYSNGQIHKIMYDLWLCLIFMVFRSIHWGGSPAKKNRVFNVSRCKNFAFYIYILHISHCEDVFWHNTSFSAALCASLNYKVRVRGFFFEEERLFC